MKMNTKSYPFISVQELENERLENKNLKIFDCRYKLTDTTWGQSEFNRGHIPGAKFIDVNTQLSGKHIPNVTGRHPLPTDVEMKNFLDKLELDKDDDIVVYDNNFGESAAARMWWMLRHLGIPNTRVLYGGYPYWKERNILDKPDLGQENDSISVEAPQKIDKEGVLSLLNDVNLKGYKLIDVRAEKRYKGLIEPIDPIAGHIPHALNVPYEDLLQYLTPKGLAKKEIEQAFLNVSEETAEKTILYCGSGITACFGILIYHAAFGSSPILYPGSWSDWIAGKTS